MICINIYLNLKEYYLYFIFIVVIIVIIIVGLLGNNKLIYIFYNFIYIRYKGKNVWFIKYR